MSVHLLVVISAVMLGQGDLHQVGPCSWPWRTGGRGLGVSAGFAPRAVLVGELVEFGGRTQRQAGLVLDAHDALRAR